MDPENTLAEVGLASIGAPLLLRQLSMSLNIDIQMTDLAVVPNIEAFATLLDERRMTTVGVQVYSCKHPW